MKKHLLGLLLAASALIPVGDAEARVQGATGQYGAVVFGGIECHFKRGTYSPSQYINAFAPTVYGIDRTAAADWQYVTYQILFLDFPSGQQVGISDFSPYQLVSDSSGATWAGYTTMNFNYNSQVSVGVHVFYYDYASGTFLGSVFHIQDAFQSYQVFTSGFTAARADDRCFPVAAAR